ncbi:HVO_0234 family beta-propeller protein [Natronobeatus ordinarius]|uniref:HVO_0234 family beta-propeller protein n=1 Tax=Natronobeatus ordinarius TaxID=2963433 RepID=UPI0020CC00CE|nr:hypothetical protein [Natronobeatus ordinarius]
MDSIEEKRVYDERDGATAVYVASATGLCRVRVSDDAVGAFGLVERCASRDVAARAGELAVATDEDVLVTERPAAPNGVETDVALEETGFGPAVAVGYDDDVLVAAAPDGRVARWEADEWVFLERRSSADVRAIDGDLVATADGVVRHWGGSLEPAGLSAVRDVSVAGVPLAATDDGLYKLGNGWMRERSGPFDVVAADPRSSPGELERAHAAAGNTLYEHDDGEWLECERADAAIVGVGYGETIYAVTEDGTFLAVGDAGWRSHSLGVVDASGLSVSRARETDRV